jgi:hypothetical protein
LRSRWMGSPTTSDAFAVRQMAIEQANNFVY